MVLDFTRPARARIRVGKDVEWVLRAGTPWSREKDRELAVFRGRVLHAWADGAWPYISWDRVLGDSGPPAIISAARIRVCESVRRAA
jgi:hypothetical protein